MGKTKKEFEEIREKQLQEEIKTNISNYEREYGK